MARVELYLLIEGQVQGVGFRRTVQRLARLLSIDGTVRNLPDDKVEICAQAERSLLDTFLKELQAQPGAAVISHMDIRFSTPRRRLKGFDILI
jgi:acylphosphatase